MLSSLKALKRNCIVHVYENPHPATPPHDGGERVSFHRSRWQPTATFVGRVVSTGKVGDVSIAKGSDGTFRRSKEKIEDEDRDKIPHWELWKAEVQVQIVEWATADAATTKRKCG